MKWINAKKKKPKIKDDDAKTKDKARVVTWLHYNPNCDIAEYWQNEAYK